MKQALTMPALSDTMNEGRLVKWLKKPGEPVKSGEAIAEVETDKAVMEVEAFHDGYLAGPLAAVDQELPVGDTIGYIADTASETQEATSAFSEASAAPASRAAAPTVAPPTAASPELSPVVAAAEANRAVSGPRAQAHLRRTIANPTDAPIGPAAKIAEAPAFLEDGPPYRIARASSLREAVARSMIAAAATPTFHITALLPLGDLVALAKAQKQSLTLLFARACARTIAAHPLFNAAYTEIGLAQRERIDIGIAVDTPDGLITPVLRDVAARSLAELDADWQRLREKVKTRRLLPRDYRGATFYVSDLGIFPVVYAFDSIVPVGAAAILSVATNGPHGAFCTLACDHRVVFGGDAARFLQSLAQLLSEPEKLLDQLLPLAY